MKKKYYVIGVYPPPYGGATVKCKLFCEMLRKNGNVVEQVDIYEMSRNKKTIPKIIIECIKAFRSNDSIVYCLDSKRLRMMFLIQNLFRKSFERTTVLVIGGIFHEIALKHKKFQKNLKLAKNVWVETDGMKKEMVNIGFNNVEVFPNPKEEEGCCKPVITTDGPLKLVFFSQISREKGVTEIIKLVHLLEDNKNISYSIDFYGQIVSDFKKEFEEFILQSPHVKYCGIFDSTKASIYKKLNEYDVLLFPTLWKGEGVPGILVEAKMAGLAVIASGINFNKEIIREEEKEGFLLKEDYPNEMLSILKECSQNKEVLYDVKMASYDSRKRYSAEFYAILLKKI